MAVTRPHCEAKFSRRMILISFPLQLTLSPHIPGMVLGRDPKNDQFFFSIFARRNLPLDQLDVYENVTEDLTAAHSP